VVDEYSRYLALLAALVPLVEATLGDIMEFVADAPTIPVQRQRGRACKAFYKWAHTNEVIDAPWFARIPVIVEKARPQATTTPEEVSAVLHSIKGNSFQAVRDRALVAVLWSSGIRRSELVKLRVNDVGEGFLQVQSAKGGRPRLPSLRPTAAALLLKYLRARGKHAHCRSEALWVGERGALRACGVRELLERRGSPSAHAFRRGWCVDSLRSGVSQPSVQAAAGWKSGAMVTRYSGALADELSMSDRVRAVL